jgi:lipopolysaccharide/colanic/teichoic acid biosynthesis glycosyltransferase
MLYYAYMASRVLRGYTCVEAEAVGMMGGDTCVALVRTMIQNPDQDGASAPTPHNTSPDPTRINKIMQIIRKTFTTIDKERF